MFPRNRGWRKAWRCGLQAHKVLLNVSIAFLFDLPISANSLVYCINMAVGSPFLGLRQKLCAAGGDFEKSRPQRITQEESIADAIKNASLIKMDGNF